MKNEELVRVFLDIKNKRWTIYSVKTGKHLGYRKRLYLKHCRAMVIEEKRKQIIRTGKKFPHAWIIGVICRKQNYLKKIQITYNPFKDEFFKSGRVNIGRFRMAYFDSNMKAYKCI